VVASHHLDFGETDLVAVVGDTHGNLVALQSAITAAAAHGCTQLVSVGDVWWRPNTPDHEAFVGGMTDALAASGVTLLLVDGNNDDAAHLAAGSFSPREVVPGVIYLPRGCRWSWGATRAGAMGGAPTFRRENKVLGVDLFEGEEISDTDVQRSVAAGEVDVLFTHDAPTGAPATEGLIPGPDEQNRRRLAEVVRAARPRLVLHGHYHRASSGVLPEGTPVRGLARDKGASADLCVIEIPALNVRLHGRVSA
jgi:hypothetical protein